MVFVEQPLASSGAACKQLIYTAKRFGRVHLAHILKNDAIMIKFNIRDFSCKYQAIKELNFIEFLND